MPRDHSMMEMPITTILPGLARALLVIGLLASSPATFAAPAPAMAEAKGIAAGPDVDSLLQRRTGFGARARGGAGGQRVVVTSPADSGPGTLRAAVEKNSGPVWVTFAGDMDIPLSSLIRVGSDVTIDGRGRKVTLLYHGLLFIGGHNVIVSNIAIDGHFSGISQAVNISRASRDIWIEHLDLARFNDRLVDVKHGSTNVTLSWIKFHDHNKVMLLNNYTDKDIFLNFERDSAASVTIDHCWFIDTVQRNPRAQFGIFHIYNNLLENWDFYGMSFSLGARVLLEGNIYSNRIDRPCLEPPAFETVEGIPRSYCRIKATAGKRAQLANGASDMRNFEVAKARFNYGPERTPYAYLRVRDNLYLGTAREGISDAWPENVPPIPYRYAYESPSEALADRIRAGAGNTLP
jgi:pectate lyase